MVNATESIPAWAIAVWPGISSCKPTKRSCSCGCPLVQAIQGIYHSFRLAAISFTASQLMNLGDALYCIEKFGEDQLQEAKSSLAGSPNSLLDKSSLQKRMEEVAKSWIQTLGRFDVDKNTAYDAVMKLEKGIQYVLSSLDTEFLNPPSLST